MPTYRLYRLLNTNVVGSSTVLTCKDDDEAIEEAIQILDRYDIEIWRGARVVKRIRVGD